MLLPHKMRATDKIIFLHIPKTAGTSAYHYFCQLLGYEQVGWLGVNFNFEDLHTPSNIARYKVIGGHLTKDQAKVIPFEKIYLSFIRDPFQRAESYYRHTMDIPSEAKILSLTGDINFDLHGPFGQHINNQQCAFLGLGTDTGAAAKLVDDGITGIATLSSAEILLAYVAHKLGRPHSPLPRENARDAQNSISISKKTRDLFGDYFSEDYLLYQKASSSHEKAPIRIEAPSIRSALVRAFRPISGLTRRNG